MNLRLYKGDFVTIDNQRLSVVLRATDEADAWRCIADGWHVKHRLSVQLCTASEVARHNDLRIGVMRPIEE